MARWAYVGEGHVRPADVWVEAESNPDPDWFRLINDDELASAPGAHLADTTEVRYVDEEHERLIRQGGRRPRREPGE